MVEVSIIQQNCATVLAQISPNIRLVAASKTRSIAEVYAAFQAGITNFGENYVQEGVEKAHALPEATWHFIGKLQTNKVNQAIGVFQVFHTIESLKLLNKLNNAAARKDLTPEVFIQVNIAGEAQKAGCTIADLPNLINAARTAPNLKLVGLMTMPPANVDPSPYFAELQKLAKAHNLKRLSIGMSGDWKEALKHGATDIRLGSTLFGARS